MSAESLDTIRYLLEGGITTLLIWIVTMVFSIPLAIMLAIINGYSIKPLCNFIRPYILLIRGTPLLFQLFFVYFGLPLIFNIEISPFAAASLAFINSWAVYMSEIFRGGIKGVDKGQYEAAKSLGFSFSQTIWFIIMPQVLVTVLPEINNQAVEVIWGTSLLSTIGMNDILKSARVVLMRDFTIEPFLLAGMIYFLFNYLVSIFFRFLENKFARYKVAEKY